MTKIYEHDCKLEIIQFPAPPSYSIHEMIKADPPTACNSTKARPLAAIHKRNMKIECINLNFQCIMIKSFQNWLDVPPVWKFKNCPINQIIFLKQNHLISHEYKNYRERGPAKIQKLPINATIYEETFHVNHNAVQCSHDYEKNPHSKYSWNLETSSIVGKLFFS